MSNVLKLKEIATLKTGPFGTQFKASEYVDEGIPVINGKNCYLTDDYNEFVNCILKLEDSDIRNEFKESSYRIIKEQYSLEALTKNRMQLYK